MRGRHIENYVQLGRMHEFFVCDPVAGTLRWKSRDETSYHIAIWNKRFAGASAGRRLATGAIQIVIKVDGVRYHTVAHRLIWAMTFGEWVDVLYDVDHRNCDPSDNRLINLRVCLPTENAKNRRLYENNTSGFKGVSWVSRYQKWGVQIQVEGGSRFKGYFDDPQQAAKAYDAAAMEHFGAFAKTNQMLGLLSA